MKQYVEKKFWNSGVVIDLRGLTVYRIAGLPNCMISNIYDIGLGLGIGSFKEIVDK
ncbi:MAG: hypothetical protein WCF23_10205 [Candidatus Nitrosopolaris sp.]